MNTKQAAAQLARTKTALRAIKRCIKDGEPVQLLDYHAGIALDALSQIEGDHLPDTIAIQWHDRTTYNRYKVACDVQDAGNLRALAREFVKVVEHASEETQSTEATWHDDAVTLFVNKLERLCRSERRFNEVYANCKKKMEATCASNVVTFSRG
ncbi:hypothetical protein [Bradyrhizobium iriomotense]|uniref:Uncharacterized protein n=1 Tax=Bradyrhizobium iriomotense TaxID=441950 RepID=A0ABQ6BCN0_9BRAD|nr:hypothetical protein [Bradyrhizobium iriomotense]GLR92142.1 hypothetical protein GCM10007857_88620 [Bradyrhizobium iriomotense]